MSKKNKDYFRRPQMFADKKRKDYASMMRSITDKAVWTKTVEKHSEFKKPYLPYGERYPEMEHFHPSNFTPAYKFPVPDLPTTPSDTPTKDICDGAVMMAMVGSVSLTCGSQTSLIMGGRTGDGSSWAPSDITWAFAYPSSARGSIQGGTYSAPPCSSLENPLDCGGIEETIMGLTPCGRSTKIIAVTVPAGCVDPCDIPLTLSGPFGTSGSSNYVELYTYFTVTGGTPPYSWTLVFPDAPGSSVTMEVGSWDDHAGWISQITGDCGSGIVTCTDSCGIVNVGTLDVVSPNGYWLLIAEAPGGTWSYSCTSRDQHPNGTGIGGTGNIFSGHYWWKISNMYQCGDGGSSCGALGAPCESYMPCNGCFNGPLTSPLTTPCYEWFGVPRCQPCQCTTGYGWKYQRMCF